MKCHFPASFTAALLNSQPMGFYAPAQLIADARKHGVEVRPVDVNCSDWDCLLEGGKGKGECGSCSLRLGFRLISGLSRTHAEQITACRREGGQFLSFDDFSRRTRLSSAVLKKLSQADAFGTLGLNRRTALWNSLPEQKQLPLFDDLADDEPAVNLPDMSLKDQVVADYQTAGVSLRGHPIQFVRESLEERQVVPTRALADLPVDRRYKVAGLVLLRQRPSTAKGITFVTLEDEFGTANLIVRQEVWERYHSVASRAGAMIAHGRLQRLDSVIHLLVDRMENLSHLLAGVNSRSRDFR